MAFFFLCLYVNILADSTISLATPSCLNLFINLLEISKNKEVKVGYQYFAMFNIFTEVTSFILISILCQYFIVAFRRWDLFLLLLLGCAEHLTKTIFTGTKHRNRRATKCLQRLQRANVRTFNEGIFKHHRRLNLCATLLLRW